MIILLNFSILIALFSFTLINASIVWIGGITDTSFKIHIDIPDNVVQVQLSLTSSFENIVETKITTSPESEIGPVYNSLRQFSFFDLQPSTLYFIGLKNNTKTERVASVRTFPSPTSNEDITIALSSCQFWTSRAEVFSDIRYWYDIKKNDSTFFMVHTGDMTYSDISNNDIRDYEASLRKVLEVESIKSVFQVMPVSYMYDDHDYGVNNAGFYSKSREAALTNYKLMVPSYDLVSNESSHHAFTVGKVRVIMSDLRALSRKDAGSTLGLSQRGWFFNQLATASSYELLMWMTSKPWISKSEVSSDSWGGFSNERLLISKKIADFNITNMFAVAGDAHMLAADNGTNTDYAERGAGFPIFQAAPIANVGTSKGGPYSEGCHGYRFFPNYQYGLVRITNIGNESGPCISFTGYTAGEREKPVFFFEKCGKIGGVKGTGGESDRCSLSLFPAWVFVLIVLAGVFLLSVIAYCIFSRCCLRKRKRGERGDQLCANESKLNSSVQNDTGEEINGGQRGDT